MTDEREAAWDELHAATPAGWQVGRPTYRVEYQEWALYAWDPRAKLRGPARSVLRPSIPRSSVPK